MYPNYQNQNAPSYEPQPRQNGGGKRNAQKEFPTNNGSYTGTVLPITGKMEDEIRVSPLKTKEGVVVHFTLLIEEPSGTDQYGQPKMKRIYRRVTAFSNNKIPEALLRSLRPGDRVKISASDIDESYDKRDGTKGYREAKLAYYIDRISAPAVQPGAYHIPAPQPAQGDYYPQGTPMPQYGAQPQYGGYPAPQAGYFPQGTPAPRYNPGGNAPQPQWPTQQPTQAPPPPSSGYQGRPSWTPGAAEQRNAQVQLQPPMAPARQAAPPYYQAPGPMAPSPEEEDMPADIAAGVKELDV